MAVNTIPLAEAEEWQHNWEASTSAAFDPMKLRSFFIPMADLYQVMKESGASNARGVLGITDEGEYKLMLVAVTDDNQTMVDEESGQYVYDMTSPCPPDCGTGPLSANKPGTIKDTKSDQ